MNKELIEKQAENFDLTDKEKTDLICALEIMEKSKAELEFAGHVLKEYRIKTINAMMGEEHKMKYPSLEEVKKLCSSNQAFEITTH